MKLLLFDVDMTLINTAGAGKRSMGLAFEQLFGKRNGLDKVSFAGRTDRAIFRDALLHQGIEWEAEKEERFKQSYFEHLKIEIAKPNRRKHVEPGILELLDILKDRSDVMLALLTGNWRQGAQIKLEHFGLFHFFRFGAFADDSEFRDKLPECAATRYTEKTGRDIHADNVFIIGDTPLDVACARPFGARSIAVATGFHSYEELKTVGPDYLFPDLSNTGQFLEILNKES